MSYQLTFWKYNDGVYLDSQKVYNDSCIEYLKVDGLSALPVKSIITDIKTRYKSWEIMDEHTSGSEKGTIYSFIFDNGSCAFEAEISEQSVLFDCRGLDGDQMNELIDIMLVYDCCLYDPQTETRFDGK